MARDYILSAASQATGVVAAGTSTLLIARWLGPAGRGEYALLAGAVQVMGLVAQIGFVTGAIYMGSRGLVPVDGLRSAAVRVTLCCGVGAVAALVGLFTLWPQLFAGAETRTFVLALGVLPLMLATNLCAGVLMGVGRLSRWNAYYIVHQVVWIVALVTALMLQRSVMAAMAAWLVAHVVWFTIVWREVAALEGPTSTAGPSTRAGLTQIVAFGLRSWIGSVIQLVNNRISLFIIGVGLNAQSAGLYSVATVMAEAIWQIAAAVTQVNLPKAAAAYERGDPSRAVDISIRLAIASTVAISIAIGVAAPAFVRIVFGPSFMGVVTPLRILLVGTALFSVPLLLSNDLVARGHPHLSSLMAAVTLATSSVLYATMIPKWGLIGAATAATLSYAVTTLVMMIVHYRITRIPPSRFVLLRPDDLSALRDIWSRRSATA